MIDDVFCKILGGEIKTDFVYRDDEIAVIEDIHPQAPVHLLVLPIKHFEGIADFSKDDSALLGRIFQIAHRIAQERGLKDGYRLISNDGVHGGKIVPHFHVHVLGGKPLGPKLASHENI